jgi:hypothetical protein
VDQYLRKFVAMELTTTATAILTNTAAEVVGHRSLRFAVITLMTMVILLLMMDVLGLVDTNTAGI